MGFTAKETREFFSLNLEDLKENLADGSDVKVSGFGKWSIKEKRSRPGRNPHTGKKIEISARRVVTFHPSDKLRDSVNNSVNSSLQKSDRVS